MQVREIMTESPAHCTPDRSLQEVAQLMVEHDCGAIPVVESEGAKRPAGIITDRDMVTRAIAQGENPMQMHAADVMTSPALRVSPSDSVEDCARLMEKNQVRRVLVVEEDETVVGIVAQADLAQQAPAEQSEEVLEEVSESSEEASRPSPG